MSGFETPFEVRMNHLDRVAARKAKVQADKDRRLLWERRRAVDAAASFACGHDVWGEAHTGDLECRVAWLMFRRRFSDSRFVGVHGRRVDVIG